MNKSTSFALLSFLGAALYGPGIAAHADEPLAEEIVVLPDTVVVKTNFGVLGSHFDGFVCEEAFLGGDSFEVAVLGPDEWVAIGENGIWVTRDGCNFDKVGDVSVAPTDATVDLESGLVAFALNSPNDGGIWLSEDRGATWTLILEREDFQWTGVRFSSSEKLIVSAYDRLNSGAAHLMEITVADGALLDRPIEGLSYPYLLDARDDTVLWLGRSETQNVYFGSMFDPTLNIRPITSWPTDARVISETKVVVAGMLQQRGLAEGELVDGAFVWNDLAATTTALCVTPDADSYLVCAQSRFDEGDVMRVSGAELSSEFLFTDLQGPRDCPVGSEVQATCPVVWRELSRTLGQDPNIEPGADVGADAGPDLGQDMDDLSTVPIISAPSKDETCSSAGGTPILLSLLGLLGMRRKK